MGKKKPNVEKVKRFTIRVQAALSIKHALLHLIQSAFCVQFAPEVHFSDKARTMIFDHML